MAPGRQVFGRSLKISQGVGRIAPGRGVVVEIRMIESDTPQCSDYYVQRAREERSLAAQCADPSAALSHLKLAEAYEKRATGGQLEGAR